MAFTIAIALISGLFAQVIARHLRIPGIVLLLATGALLGPDGLNVVRTEQIGNVLQVIVGYAVAIILFEGGMNLNIHRLRRESSAIQKLITLGSLITAVGGTLAAKMLMGWSWQLSILFGTLVIVTGPTVITPLLRRIKVNHNVHTILEAEGVLIDPIGAIIAIVALEIVIHPSGGAFAFGLFDALLRLGIGALIGLAGGFVIAYLMKPKNLIGEGLENIFVLAFVLALYHICNEIKAESGIASVVAAGIVVGNIKTPALRDLMEFKEQLTFMLIALLFVLLAADVRLSDVTALGTPGILTVVVLMLIVRPLNIFVSTHKSNLNLSEKLFLSWLAPRGIVAAAVASFAAISLDSAGIEGGESLRALVFLVIAMTVLVQGLSGAFLSKLLKVNRTTSKGFAILGANELARTLGRQLVNRGESVLFLDSNPNAIRAAETDGFRAVYGNALEDRVLQRSNLGDCAGCIAFTTNEEINLLFLSKVSGEFKIPKLYAALHEKNSRVSPEIIRQSGAHLLFGQKCDISLWSIRIKRNLVALEDWIIEKPKSPDSENSGHTIFPLNILVPLIHLRSDKPYLVDETTKLKHPDSITFLIYQEQKNDAVDWLAQNNWRPKENITPAEKSPTPVTGS